MLVSLTGLPSVTFYVEGMVVGGLSQLVSLPLTCPVVFGATLALTPDVV